MQGSLNSVGKEDGLGLQGNYSFTSWFQTVLSGPIPSLS